MNPSANCCNCVFFNAKGDGSGECRHDPPAIQMIPQVDRITRNQYLRAMGIWPPVRMSDWCGRFKQESALAPAS